MAFGLVICIIMALLAVWISGLQHYVGAPIIGMLFGILLRNSSLFHKFNFSKGTAFSSKYLLKVGIVLAGGTLNFMQIVGLGAKALPLICFNIVLAFLISYLIGKIMGVSINTRVLVGGGTAICGGTAIATLSPVIKAKETEMAYAMAAIFLFDVFAAIFLPYLAAALSLSPTQYGFLGGLAISDTSSVVAAGVTFNSLMGTAAIDAAGNTAGDLAVIVKLTRTTMLIIVVLMVMVVQIIAARKTQASQESFSIKVLCKSFPLFVIGFLLMAILNTVGLIPSGLTGYLKTFYKFLITVALVGVGYKIRLNDLFKNGVKPLLLGGCAWFCLFISTGCYVLFLL